VVPVTSITQVKSCQAALGYYKTGLRQKIMASHQMNAASSRSHCLFCVTITSVDPGTSKGGSLDLLDLLDSLNSLDLHVQTLGNQALGNQVVIFRAEDYTKLIR
jgi:hypothetical protein